MLFKRLRKLRNSQKKRDSHSEIFLSPQDFIQPFFVCKGSKRKISLLDLPGINILSVDILLQKIPELLQVGINKILLFASTTPEDKDENGTQSFSQDNIIVQTIHMIKKIYPDLIVFSDVCLCSYTSHGHCGLFKNNSIVNDQTLDILSKIALIHAQMGVDYVCPSAMMDGQVMAIRKCLDDNHIDSTKILSYSIKYASHFYKPFRNATGLDTTSINRKSYQMDFRNFSQAHEEVNADIEEKADAFIVKPAHTYLDILYRMRQDFPNITLVAYHVSGECSFLANDFPSYEMQFLPALQEIFYAFKRSGANWIISYYAQHFYSKGLS